MSTGISGSCDAAVANSNQPRPTQRPNLVLATTILASSLAFIDGSVVNVGLPTIGASLKASPDALQWIVNAYLLPLSALLLLGGSAGDLYGRRRLLIIGTALFAFASLCCASAPTLGILLIGRFLQGVAAAMVMPNSLAILRATFTGEAKGRAIGIWAAAGAVMGAIGPVVGGWLIDLVSWRAIFLINLPLAICAIMLAQLSVPADLDHGKDLLDWAGGSLATLGLGGLTWALTLGSGQEGWTATTIGLAMAAVVLLLAFVAVEGRRGERAMMPLSLFVSSRFVGLTIFTLFLYGALGTLLVLVPYVLIEAGGYSGSAAGAALLPLPIVLALISPLMGGLASHLGARLPLGAGSLIVACGFLLTLRIETTSSYWTTVLPAILVIALGLSGAVAPLTTAVLDAVAARNTGSASGFNSAVARTGGLVATAMLGSVLAARGSNLISAFHTAMLAASAASAIAALCAFLLIPSQRKL